MKSANKKMKGWCFMLFPERRFGLVNNSNNLFDYLFSDPIFNVNVPNRMSTDIKQK